MNEKKKIVIVSNKIKCKKCGDVIESKTRHDFKWCSCQSVAVDGGHDYIRRIGKDEDYFELFETREICEVQDENKQQ